MYKNHLNRHISMILSIILILTTIISASTTVFADYSGDMLSFLTPEEILGSIPKYNGDPFTLPNPLNGILPASPAIGGSDQPPQAPGEIEAPNMPDLNN
ncbi:MAG: hypothetical protein WBL93_06475, partial [Lutisporaceae bacterium]